MAPAVHFCTTVCCTEHVRTRDKVCRDMKACNMTQSAMNDNLMDTGTAIGMNAFENNACEADVIPEGCQSVGSHAFQNCKNLRYVRLPYDLEIASDAFEGCGQVQFERVGGE